MLGPQARLQAPMAATARLRYAAICTAEQCSECQGELALVLKSSADTGVWWRCQECKAFHMTPGQKKNEALWWGGPEPPATRGGRGYALLDEQASRAREGLRVYTVDASIWLHSPARGRRLAELGLDQAEAFVMDQVHARFSAHGATRLTRSPEGLAQGKSLDAAVRPSRNPGV